MVKSMGRASTGQVITEYVLMLAVMLGVVLALMFMLYYFTNYGFNVLGLVSIEYP